METPSLIRPIRKNSDPHAPRKDLFPPIGGYKATLPLSPVSKESLKFCSVLLRTQNWFLVVPRLTPYVLHSTALLLFTPSSERFRLLFFSRTLRFLYNTGSLGAAVQRCSG